MGITSAFILNYYPIACELKTRLLPQGVFSNTRPGVNYSVFTKTPELFIIRKDSNNTSSVVNVFDTLGSKVYTIERHNSSSEHWTIYAAANRRPVALVRAGLFTREIQFNSKPEIRNRRVGRPRLSFFGLPDRRFYLDDGAPYEWTSNSRYLERIVNPGGGPQEERVRLARVRLLRTNSFDWELAVDRSLDREVALATAFISLLLQWSSYFSASPGLSSEAQSEATVAVFEQTED